MTHKRSLRERARSGERLCGALLRMPSEELTEMVAVAGLDFILIDCEHGPADVTALRNHIALAMVHGIPTIVRVGEDERALVLRALDQGAQGILAPHLDSRADAEALIQHTMYPPQGARGFATYSRAGKFGTVDAASHRDWYAEHTLVFGMIESPAGVRSFESILATPRLDGLLIGPADLAASSGPGDPDVSSSIAKVNAALAASELLRMDIVNTPAAAEAAFADGANIVVYNLASSLLKHLQGLGAVAR